MKVGDLVKLLFEGETAREGEPRIERMWVEVTSATEKRYRGTPENTPRYLLLRAGDEVEFGPEHIASYYWSPESSTC